ncbi:hypothetical protein CAMRE0001_0028 [Campylobacter rectus RM3267]|uniref:Uncharacterized protein n=1 Tax=Campylobacter rectus RM3267 TaxID=553218 RepID=B9D3H4_CAMRE|nr:hypothetical protein CAMRE0001_0028 [Campylobacter rectus RM3267]
MRADAGERVFYAAQAKAENKNRQKNEKITATFMKYLNIVK